MPQLDRDEGGHGLASVTLITGGAGFIGSHLAARLIAGGRRVRIIDNLSTGRRENVSDLPSDSCELIVGDVADYIQKPGVLSDVKEVYHLAAAVGVKLIVDQPAAMIRNNVEKAAVVLESCATAGVPILVASSSEVYGKCPVLPLHEEMDLVFGPTSASRWSYGMTKAIDEHLAIDLHQQQGLSPVIVRLFNTIGPRQIGQYGMVVPRFIEAACKGESLTVYGDGKQTRAFCDVRDVVDAMVKLMAQPDAVGRVCNLGNDHSLSIGELAQMVIDLVGEQSDGRIKPTMHLVDYQTAFGPGFEDPPHRLPDIARLKMLIGFTPKYSLHQTLSELVSAELNASRPIKAKGVV